MFQYYIDKGEQRGEIKNSVKVLYDATLSFNDTLEQAIEALKIDESIKDEVIKVHKKTYC